MVLLWYGSGIVIRERGTILQYLVYCTTVWYVCQVGKGIVINERVLLYDYYEGL